MTKSSRTAGRYSREITQLGCDTQHVGISIDSHPGYCAPVERDRAAVLNVFFCRLVEHVPRKLPACALLTEDIHDDVIEVLDKGTLGGLPGGFVSQDGASTNVTSGTAKAAAMSSALGGAGRSMGLRL